ncbi:MAG: class I SAM-dependent methyltransferase [Deltaproteobacteria bacterium]|nr:class I SAM-dependent methyltransferase [Deltaproteobacteria bacterium]
MTRKTLHQLYAEHAGKVSDKWSLYLTEYDRLLDDYRESPIRLLEIGIQNGGSLEIWSKYFKQAAILIGCDINPACAGLRFDDPRIGVIVGDANGSDVREQIVRRTPQVDIIIDDGSHQSSDMIKSFAMYFPMLADGGIYILEDMHCSYWESFGGGLFHPFSAVTFFKHLVDIIHYEHWGYPEVRAGIFQGFFTTCDCHIDFDVLSQVKSVEFINSICVVRKAPAADDGSGRRLIVGAAEKAAPGMSATDESKAHPLDEMGNGQARPKPTEECLADTQYERLLRGYREKPVCLLKIGMQNGGSLDFWSEYFSQAAMVIGCDVDPACAGWHADDPLISVIAGDAHCPDVRERIIRSTPQFDIIIDDGSHVSGDMIKTFVTYFPMLTEGGIFIVRNIDVSYREKMNAGLFAGLVEPFSAMAFFKHFVDIINHEHWGFPRTRADILQSIFTKYKCHIGDEALSQVHSVEFINSLCAVRKAADADNGLGRRMIGGTVEIVTPEILRTHGSESGLLDQIFNPWTRLGWAEEDLADAKWVLADTESALADAERQIAQMTSSRSWKMTRPLRKTARWMMKRMPLLSSKKM